MLMMMMMMIGWHNSRTEYTVYDLLSRRKEAYKIYTYKYIYIYIYICLSLYIYISYTGIVPLS